MTTLAAATTAPPQAGSHQPPLRLAIDIGFAASAYLKGGGKFGILRVTDELVREIGARSGVRATAVGLSPLSGEPLFDSFVTVLGAQKAFPGIAAEHCVRSRFGVWGLYERVMPRYTVRTLTPGGASPALRAAVKLLKRADCVPDFSPEGFDLFFSLLNALPSRTVTGELPRVLNVYDLICVRHPEWCTVEQVDWQRGILGSIDPEKDWLICNSEYVRADVCDYLKMDPARVAVVPLGVSPDFRPVDDAATNTAVRAKYGLPTGGSPYLLSLAALQPRKNLTHLIRCFTRLLAEQPSLRETRLVLAGERGWKFDEILNASEEGREFGDRILFTGYVADEDLSGLYSGAHGFVFPSLSEGFGLPPLEAMACGTPVIAASATSLPEVVEGAGILVDPHDRDALCGAMQSLLEDAILRADLARRGRERASAFTWARTADEMLTFVRRIVVAGGRERQA